MTDKEKQWIDNASLEQLLSWWRFAPAGDPWFTDKERADYHAKVMGEKRKANESAFVSASKKLGW